MSSPSRFDLNTSFEQFGPLDIRNDEHMDTKRAGHDVKLRASLMCPRLAWGIPPMVGEHRYDDADHMRPTPRNAWPLAAMIPWAVFLTATLIGASASSASKSIEWRSVPVGAVFYLQFVALPSFVALWCVRPGGQRVSVGVVMTVAAAVLGFLAGSIDDAQAGLAVIWIWPIALAIVVISKLLPVLGNGLRRATRG